MEIPCTEEKNISLWMVCEFCGKDMKVLPIFPFKTTVIKHNLTDNVIGIQ